MMYKARHKKTVQLKPDTKVISLAATGMMLAAPLINSVSPAAAATNSDDQNVKTTDPSQLNSRTVVNATVKMTEANKTALQKAIDNAKNVQSNADYKNAKRPTTSRADLDSAITKATTALNNDATTDAQAQAEMTAVQTASNTYEADAKASISLANAINSGNKTEYQDTTKYTYDSIFALQDAVSAGGAVLNQTGQITSAAFQSSATNAANAINNAINNLKLTGTTTASKTQLTNLYNSVKDYHFWDYTKSTWTDFNAARTRAANILNASNPSQAEVNIAYQYLTTTQKALAKASDTDALKVLGDKYQMTLSLNKAQFTADSWAALVDAQTYFQDNVAADKAGSMFDTPVSTINEAATKLQTALTNLKTANGQLSQKQALADLLNQVNGYGQGDASDTDWTAFTTARDKAASVLKGTNSTVIDYMSALQALQTAVTKLGDTADTSYVSTASYSDVNGVGKVFFTGSRGIVLYNKPEGKQVNDANGNPRFLQDQSRWKVFRKAVLSDGSAWYEVGRNQWISARFTMIEQAGVGTIDFLPNLGLTLWDLEPDGVHATGRRLDNGTQWQTFGNIMVDGREYTNLGANQWIESQYLTIENTATSAPVN
ncbi:hypothetical protein ACNAN0_01230 [Agrilactobacillus fermenti]|uniref:hypothetical protein n=1 Tax=Agrilactobacillus fermenti TaxID=2586909 RepID=UPI003A5BFB19